MNPIRRAFRCAYEKTRTSRNPIFRAAFGILWTCRALFRLVFGALMRLRHRINAFLRRPAMRLAYHLLAATRDVFRGTSASQAAGWTETHLQQALNIVSARLLRARDWRLRTILLGTSALQKYRERTHASTIDFCAIVDHSVDQSVLRNFVVLQHDILRDPRIPSQAKVNLLLRIDPRVRDGRLNELFSLFCLSDLFCDLSIHWEDTTADAAERQILTLPELQFRQNGQLRRFALSVVPLDTVEEVEHFGVPRAFLRMNDARRNANTYLKATFAWHFVVAVSLRENADGCIDEELARWEPILSELEREFPAIRITLLNRASRKATIAHHDASRLPYACEAGLNLLDTVAVAQQANAYFGVLDIHGLAARSAGVPGVYLPLDYDLYDDSGTMIPPGSGSSWRIEYPSLAGCRQALRHVLTDQGAARIQRFFSRSA